MSKLVRVETKVLLESDYNSFQEWSQASDNLRTEGWKQAFKTYVTNNVSYAIMYKEVYDNETQLDAFFKEQDEKERPPCKVCGAPSTLVGYCSACAYERFKEYQQKTETEEINCQCEGPNETYPEGYICPIHKPKGGERSCI